MRKLFILCVVSGIFFSSCSDDDNNSPNSDCDKNIIVNEARFAQTSTENYHLENIVLNENCLEITIGASGCDSESWEINLIASEMVVETSPVQHLLKIDLFNPEDCTAYIQKTISFDISDLQSSSENQVQLNIDGWDDNILYSY